MDCTLATLTILPATLWLFQVLWISQLYCFLFQTAHEPWPGMSTAVEE